MTEEDRRAFLRKLAGTAAYTAPVVYSMAAPMDIVAQQTGKGQGSVKKKDWGDDPRGTSGMTSFVPPPPGSRPPGSGGG
jgi:hypothetical protein